MQQKLDNGFVVIVEPGSIYLKSPGGGFIDGENHMIAHRFRSVDEAIETANYLYESGECSTVGGSWSRWDDEANSKQRKARTMAEIALQNALNNIHAPYTLITFASEAIEHLRELANA